MFLNRLDFFSPIAILGSTGILSQICNRSMVHILLNDCTTISKQRMSKFPRNLSLNINFRVQKT